MRDTLITIFIVIPFITNLVSLGSGILLWVWLIFLRRRRRGLRSKGNR